MNTYTITLKENYLEVITDGDKDLQSATKLWTDIIKACKTHQCYKILGIAHSNNAFSTLESYEHVELFNSLGIDKQYKIAWFESNSEALEKLNMMETILLASGNRQGRVFSDPDLALEWLLENN